jgi:hypothetical protein
MRAPMDSSRPPTRAVRIAKLAQKFATRLEELKHPSVKFTSAELAVEMVESPGLVEFTAPK